MEKFLTVRQTADLLNMHFMTVYQMVQSGTLPALKIGNRWKIREDMLREWIEEQDKERPQTIPEIVLAADEFDTFLLAHDLPVGFQKVLVVRQQ